MIKTLENFSPKIIADSGQCFRMTTDDNKTSLIALDKPLTITELSTDTFEFSCSEEDFENFWKHYFDLDRDYHSIMKNICLSDDYVNRAFNYGRGMKILNQDPFEMVISFILSQRKSIPSIRSSIEKLCKLCGEQVDNELYAFPTPKALSSLSIEELNSCSLGYRSPYISQVAKRIANKELLLENLHNLDDDALISKLMEEHGVGIKVASCVALFGYHRLSICPIDVWMNKIIDRHYEGISPFEEEGYKEYAGIIQQYVFFYERMMDQNKK